VYKPYLRISPSLVVFAEKKIHSIRYEPVVTL